MNLEANEPIAYDESFEEFEGTLGWYSPELLEAHKTITALVREPKLLSGCGYTPDQEEQVRRIYELIMMTQRVETLSNYYRFLVYGTEDETIDKGQCQIDPINSENNTLAFHFSSTNPLSLANKHTPLEIFRDDDLLSSQIIIAKKTSNIDPATLFSIAFQNLHPTSSILWRTGNNRELTGLAKNVENGLFKAGYLNAERDVGISLRYPEGYCTRASQTDSFIHFTNFTKDKLWNGRYEVYVRTPDIYGVKPVPSFLQLPKKRVS